MAVLWPRPQRLLPPKLLDALDAVQRGDSDRALRLVGTNERSDPLTVDVMRLVRGLVAVEAGDRARALRLLRPLLRSHDESVALAATLASVEVQMQLRGFARAAPWIERAKRHAADEATQIALGAVGLRLQMLRHGTVREEDVGTLRNRLLRRHPAAVHACVHLVEAERALFAGDFVAAELSERAARPHVASAKLAALRRQHQALSALLHDAHVAEVEDWERPRRPMTRAEIAELQREPWQVWIDFAHRWLRFRVRARDTPVALHFASAAPEWNLLAALAASSRRRLDWAQVQRALDLDSESLARRRAGDLHKHLDAHGAAGVLQVQASFCALRPKRFVHLLPAQPLPAAHQQILAVLAERPGARCVDLQRIVATRQRTVQSRLLWLRNRGLVRLVGGGREARYYVV